MVGRVVDFSVIKEKIGGFIDAFWDHNMILYARDEDAIKAIRSIPGNRQPFIAPWNPTAENIAEHQGGWVACGCVDVIEERGFLALHHWTIGGKSHSDNQKWDIVECLH